MKVLVDIQDGKVGFAIKVLNSLSFVRKAQPISKGAAELWIELADAAEEVKQHKHGEVKLKTAKDLLHEL